MLVSVEHLLASCRIGVCSPHALSPQDHGLSTDHNNDWDDDEETIIFSTTMDPLLLLALSVRHTGFICSIGFDYFPNLSSYRID
jgi:hypothetical protein